MFIINVFDKARFKEQISNSPSFSAWVMEGMSGNWTCFLPCLPVVGLRSDVKGVGSAVGLCVGVAVAVTLVSLFVVRRRELRQDVAVVVGCTV